MKPRTISFLFFLLLSACASNSIFSDDPLMGMGQQVVAQWGSSTPFVFPKMDPALESPDINLEFDSSMLKRVVREFIGPGIRIPLKNEKLKALEHSYIILTRIDQFQAKPQGSLYVSIQGQAVFKGRISQKTIDIKSMGIHLVPQIQSNKNRYFLKAKSFVSFLDLQNVPAKLDRALVNLINEQLQSEKLSEQMKFDISPLLNPVIPHPFAKGQLDLMLKKAAVIVAKDKLIVQAKR